MDFRLLGPLEVLDGDAPLEIAAGKQRALLTLLLLNDNRTVAADRIVDDLWGEEVPGSARKMVQIHVSQLRKALPEPRLRTRAPGYLLEVRDGELDLRRFERLVEEGRAALERGDASVAGERLGSALALWRGPALAEFAEPFARHEAGRLEELRLGALELRVDADLALGRHADVVGELETLVGRYPLRERLRLQHMLALYRSGRQAEALTSYREFRKRLDAELGIEPSPALKELERRILRQDEGLDTVPAAATAAAVRPSPPAATPAGLESEIRHARSGDVRIAYQVVGEGDVDLVLVHGWVCTFQPGWENPRLAAFYRRLASLGRLILFDKRGTGLSDRVSADEPPDLETRMDDVRAVLDAAGSRRAAVLGISEGGPLSVLFAASHPERTLALVLIGTFARMMRADDYPIGLSPQEHDRRLAAVDEDDWATATTNEWLARVAPDLLRDPAAVQWYRSYILRGASPAATKAIRIMNAEIDVRDVLPAISVPTLVLYRSREYFREGTRYMGERIPRAQVVELPGNDHLPWEGDAGGVLNEIERFLRSVREEEEPDRVLATILFTDIVGSTATAAEVGDRAWGELLAAHFRIVRSQLARYRGSEVETTGDGVFALFDGPARAVRCAAAIVDASRAIGLGVRAGVHTGEIEQADGGASGLAVHIGARIASAAAPDEVLVSSTVKDIVAGSGLRFDDRGKRSLAGVPGSWRLYAAVA